MKIAFAPAALLLVSLTVASAQSPQWWTQRAVQNSNQAKDYAAANIGQAKNMAAAAYAEMKSRGLINTQFPTVSTANNELFQKWESPSAGTTDYAAVNIGQLKALAKPFYDRLAELGYSVPPLQSGQVYPWSPVTTDDSNYATANIGQLKYLFSFDFSDEDADGRLDAWERQHLGGVTNGDLDLDSNGIPQWLQGILGTSGNGYGVTMDIANAVNETPSGAQGGVGSGVNRLTIFQPSR